MGAHPALLGARGVAVLAVLAVVAGCAGDPPPLPEAKDTVYAHALADIGSLYVDPVSLRRVALAGAARLNALDPEIATTDSFSGAFSEVVAIRYRGLDVASVRAPAGDDPAQLGRALAEVVIAARRASPVLAALPQENTETAILQGMTGALDPYSRYSAPEAARNDRAERDGTGGIGVTLDAGARDGRITDVNPDSPAAKAGIRPDDRIVAIGAIKTAGNSPENVLDQLRGPVGTPIAVRVLHPSDGGATHVLELQRTLMTPRTVAVSRDGGIVIIKVTGFNRNTAHDVAAALQATARQDGPPNGIVLDLRSNPGGLLDQAVDLASLFITSGPIAAATGRNPASRQYFAAAGSSVAAQTPLAVLVNGGSASAAEIVAAAMQDAGRAVIIGSSTYGKGTVQTVLHLPNDGELVLSWARLIAPEGYLLQYHGVVPTICTASRQDDPATISVDLQRAITAPPIGLLRQRAALDEPGWAALRQECPPMRGRNGLDLALAERLLADPKLYAEALLALPEAKHRADEKGARHLAGPDLTGADRGLSSEQP
jgi:carboxyl-terminal processing protease